MEMILKYINLSQILQGLQEGISCIKNSLFGLGKPTVLSSLVDAHWGKLVKRKIQLVVLHEEIIG